jgi:hypothetical protein
MKMTARLVVGLFSVLLAVTSTFGAAQQSAVVKRATPIEPIGAIIEAFRSHDVVALGEGDHGNEQGHAFRLSLIRDPRFPVVVNDIVVEAGNALYQDVMDRFIRGEDVSEQSLRRVWQNTTQPFTTFDSPIYEEFYRAVRSVNMSIPRERQLRVLLGDPPVDWDHVRSPADLGEWKSAMAHRDSHPADLIKRDVLPKHRHALMIHGDMHFQRKNLDFNYVDVPQAQTIVNMLENDPATRVFTIWTNTAGDLQTLQDDVSSWRKPSLAMIRGTALGAADFTFYYRFEVQRVAVRGNTFEPIPRDQWRRLRMEDQVDAVLYLGAPSEITDRPFPPALCADPTYMKMRLDRFALMGMSAGADRLKRDCAKIAEKPN